MTEIAFQGFPKVPRLFREMVVTEKIDGTNAAVGIVALPSLRQGSLPRSMAFAPELCALQTVHHGPEPEDSVEYGVYAQSRKRIIVPGDDNFGFAAWVAENARELIGLGEGLHFGEWWGSGIQRGYGLPQGEKRFSLFNTNRWHEESPDFDGRPLCCDVVPVLYEGAFDLERVRGVTGILDQFGSRAAPGFKPAEGVVIFHVAANRCFKFTIEKDAEPKSAQKEAA